MQKQLLYDELDLAVLYDVNLLSEVERTVLRCARPHMRLPADHPFMDRDAVSRWDLRSSR